MPELPKIVSTRLAALGSSEHLDADLLTAFMEGTLSGRERDGVLSHVSRCRECRQVIALALPESIAEAVSAGAGSTRTAWLRMPVLRWGALVACLIAVAATVLIQRREQVSRHEVQVALKVTPPTAANPASNPPASVPEVGVSRSETKAKIRRAPAHKSETAPQEMASNAPGASPPVASSANTATADIAKKSETVQIQAGTVPAGFAPAARADQVKSAPNTVAAAKSAPLFTARPSTETAASTIGGAARLTDFRTPSWRLSQDDGLPERSFAPGQWEKLQVDHKSGFRVIAAHDMEVWIGGPDGLLYHSEDVGLHWTRIMPVSSNGTLTENVTGIDFADHMHGQIHTSGDQIWVTSDAGKTWEIQQP